MLKTNELFNMKENCVVKPTLFFFHTPEVINTDEYANDLHEQ